jgi:hypothetical protein
MLTIDEKIGTRFVRQMIPISAISPDFYLYVRVSASFRNTAE